MRVLLAQVSIDDNCICQHSLFQSLPQLAMTFLQWWFFTLVCSKVAAQLLPTVNLILGIIANTDVIVIINNCIIILDHSNGILDDRLAFR
jgi:hypothetical protein